MKMRLGGCVHLVTCCWFIILLVAAAHRTHPSEVSAIMAFKSSLVDPMKHLSGWNKGDPCSSNWNGVLCFNTTKADGFLHVRQLQLMNMNLSGTLSPDISQLSQLRILNVMWNDLTGSIPKEIGDIAYLRLLLLNGNKLSGVLPTELGRLINLNRFQIDQNHISGPIPESFSNLKSLVHVHFNNNSLSGGIPSQLSYLTNLRHLLLDNNNLTGHLPPELSNIPQLRILQLDNNNFTEAEIPKSYGELVTLVKLSIRNCSLQGAIPDLSRIRNLSFLDLSHNQLAGPIPSNHLSVNITTINLSCNKLNGSIPESFSGLPSLQELLLHNNALTGYIPTKVWQNMSFSAQDRLLLDLRNNSLTNIQGDLNPPVNVTLRLQGNPICSTRNNRKLDKFCGPEAEVDDSIENTKDSIDTCPVLACPAAQNFEYVPASPLRCFCAAPLRIGYRLKSPSFSYFLPYFHPFERYLTSALDMDLYQLSIESYAWEKGRLRMYLALFPMANDVHSNTLNESEVLRIKDLFTSWNARLQNDFYGPYELLNFTLLGPYLYGHFESQRKSMSLGVLVAILLASVICATAIAAVITVFFGKRWYNMAGRHRSSRTSIKISGVREFTFREMDGATCSFHESTQIGQGGYGVVYRGILPDGMIVAIKRAKKGSLQCRNEFMTEIEMLSRAHHKNLVSLVGYCDQYEEQMLVYEFMPNGTLQDWLSGEFEEVLNFSTRLQIALDSTMGILYLHTEADPPIFHRDIKATNILLDSGLNAKVSDFGLSLLAPVLDDEGFVPNHVSTVVKGTPGYLDPEYILTRKLTEKSDVYSLGVVFLEILTGMRAISRGKNIVRELIMAHQSGSVLRMMDRRMGSYNSEQAEKFVALALKCCRNKPEERPFVLDVVRELEDILQMMPQARLDASKLYFNEPLSAPNASWSMSGSDLSSVTPPTFPR